MHSHDSYLQYSHGGFHQKGIATRPMGAEQYEVWRSTITPGSQTPLYIHESEKIIVLLKGQMRAFMGSREFECKAPATLICPAFTPHQFTNRGDESCDLILVFGIDSTIYDENGMGTWFPWR